MTTFQNFSNNNNNHVRNISSNFNFQNPYVPSQIFYNSSFSRALVDKGVVKEQFPISKAQDQLNGKITDLKIMNAFTSRAPWPNDRDHTLDDLNIPKLESMIGESKPVETSILDSLPSYSSVTGLVAGTLNNSIMDALTQQNYTKTMQGNTPMQGDFNAQRTAQVTSENRNIATAVSSTIMSASALLGPEAFAAGTIVGAGIDIATELGEFDSTPVPVNTN